MAHVKLQFRVTEDVAERLHQFVEEAKIRGADISLNKAARALLQSALGVPQRKAIANEVVIEAYAYKQRISNRMGELVAENLDELLESASEPE